MPSTQFQVTSGDPRMQRTTNMPAIGVFTFCGWVQIASYVPYGAPFAIEGGGVLCIYVETDGTDLYVYRNDGAGHTGVLSLYPGSFTGWLYVAITVDATATGQELKIYRGADGDGTVTLLSSTSFASAWTATSISVGSEAVRFPTDGNGTFRAAGWKIYSRVLSQAQIEAEKVSLTPVSTSSLTFANDGQNAATFHVDQSVTGGNFTPSGTTSNITTNASTPTVVSSGSTVVAYSRVLFND